MTTNNDVTGRPEHVAHRFEKSRDLLEWLGGEFAHRARLGRKAGGQPDDGMARPGVTQEAQVARVCELVNLALTQVDLYRDLGTAWILLEQARQQLGHAATSAEMTTAGRRPDDYDANAEAETPAPLVWFLQRDLMPWPDDASVAVEFEGETGRRLPDFRPDTPLELLSLQLLAHSAMTSGAGDAVQDLDDKVMAMAFGEYVSMIMVEAMELLENCPDQNGEAGLAEVIDIGHQVSRLIAGAFPPAWQVFQGPAGFPDSSG